MVLPSRKGPESPGETLPLPKMGAENLACQSSPTSSGDKELATQENPMKIIVSALVALSVLAGIAAPASAFDAKGFYGQLDRQAN